VLLGFVTTGQGVTLLPKCSVTTELGQGRVLAVPIHNPALLSAEVQLITRAGRQLSPAANRFCSTACRACRRFRKPPDRAAHRAGQRRRAGCRP